MAEEHGPSTFVQVDAERALHLAWSRTGKRLLVAIRSFRPYRWGGQVGLSSAQVGDLERFVVDSLAQPAKQTARSETRFDDPDEPGGALILRRGGRGDRLFVTVVPLCGPWDDASTPPEQVTLSRGHIESVARSLATRRPYGDSGNDEALPREADARRRDANAAFAERFADEHRDTLDRLGQ